MYELFLNSKTGENIVDSLPLAIYTTDTEGRLTYFNASTVEFAGTKPELHSDKCCIRWKFYYPDGKPMPHDKSPMAVALKEGYTIHGQEVIAERPDGKHIWFKVYSSPLYNDSGECIGGRNVLVDITDQKEMENQLTSSKQELFDFFENASAGLHLTQSDGTIKRVNQTMLNILGRSREELIGRNISEFHADQDVFREIMEKLSAGEELTDFEIRLLHKDGSIRHALLNSNVYRENGKFVHTRCIIRDITPRRKAEAELSEVTSESERQKRLYEAILSSTPDLVYIFDLNYRIIFANEALMEMWGYTRGEYHNKSLLEIGYEPWHAEMHEREIDQVIATKKPIQGEVSFPHKKLGRRIYEYIFVPVLDDKGTVEAVAGTTRDVTKRKETEQALSKSEKKYRTLFETMNDGFVILQMEFDEKNNPVDFRYLETNPAANKHTGLPDRAGKKVSEVLPGLETYWLETYGEVALTGKPVHVENYAEKLDRWFDVSAFRIGYPEERTVAVLFQNITERKRSQEKCDRLLRQVKIEQDRLADIFQHAPSLMAILQGPDHVVKRINNRTMKLAGDRKILGKPAREVFPEAGQQDFFDLLDRVYETGEPFKRKDMPVTLQHQKKSNIKIEKRYLDIVCQPIHDSGGSISGVFIQGVDLTERKKAREKLKAINETLEERVEKRTQDLLSYQNQLRSLAFQLSKTEENQRQLLAAELHDNLGQLLALGKMKADLLQSGQDSAHSKKILSDLQEVLDDALTYTRNLMTTLQPPPSLNNDIRARLDWVAGKLKKHGLEVIIEDDGQPKPLDEELTRTVYQSVRELLLNVIRHTSQKEARVRLNRKKDQLQITVQDEGKGFDSENGELAAPDKGGRFGLFHIQERIDLLGGRVDIKTKRGKGTKVTLHVPLTEEPSEALEHTRETKRIDKTTTGQNRSGGKIKILLAEDHQMVRKGLRTIIEDEDDIVVIGEAADGEEAIHLTRQTSPDIILMDVNMPGMDGIEATRIIMNTMPHSRIIGLSLHDEEKVAEDMKNAGASAYLTKSEAFEFLIETIRAEASVSKSE